MMRYVKFSVLILACLVLHSCGSRKGGKDEKGKGLPEVDVVIATIQDITNTVEVNGSVLSGEMIELHPEISGRITYLNIPDGSRVSEGTVLARINDADLQAEMMQLRIKLDLAKKTEQRLKQLLAVNGVDQSSYDAALSAVNDLESGIHVKQAELDKTVIKAPFSGILGLRMVSPGAYVTPSTVMGTLQQINHLKIDFTVPESYADLIKSGAIVRVITNYSPDTLRATIIAIEPQANLSTRNFRVRAVPEKPERIIPGSFARVLLQQMKQGIMVPSNAIIPEARSNQIGLVKDGKAVFVNVETGLRTEKYVELLNGVSPGDSIIVSGLLFVRPGAKLKVKNEK